MLMNKKRWEIKIWQFYAERNFHFNVCTCWVIFYVIFCYFKATMLLGVKTTICFHKYTIEKKLINCWIRWEPSEIEVKNAELDSYYHLVFHKYTKRFTYNYAALASLTNFSSYLFLNFSVFISSQILFCTHNFSISSLPCVVSLFSIRAHWDSK